MLTHYITLLSFSSLAASTILPSQFDFSQIPLIDNSCNEAKSCSDPYATSLQSAKENANHIFNTLHSAMRQWGSSYHHNGMSLIPATVPTGINLYHGGPNKDRVVGPEWLAFEIEHAEMFARGFRQPRDGDRKPGHGGPPGPPPSENRPSQLELLGFMGPSENPKFPDPPNFTPGYLHTYRTNRPLNLVYIDGMGAAKCDLGTLDTQDVILRNRTSMPSPRGDMARGRDLCSLPKLWDVPVDGFIRMEAGFEIIHCDFSTAGGLDMIDARLRPESNEPAGNRGRNFFEYFRGVSMRYQGIGASRVELSFEKMVSAYFYPANLTNPNPKREILPRLPFEDVPQIERMRQDLKDFLMDGKASLEINDAKVDWQGMVDMIITRYADRLEFIASGQESMDMLGVINILLNAFINYEDFDRSRSIEKCARNYFMPAESFTWNRQDHLIGTAILTVSERICETLFDVRDDLLSSLDEEQKAFSVGEKTKELMKYLDWSRWKECDKCRYDEVCFISMWPFGGSQDHFNPICKNKTALQDQPMRSDNYWNMDMDRN